MPNSSTVAKVAKYINTEEFLHAAGSHSNGRPSGTSTGVGVGEMEMWVEGEGTGVGAGTIPRDEAVVEKWKI